MDLMVQEDRKTLNKERQKRCANTAVKSGTCAMDAEVARTVEIASATTRAAMTTMIWMEEQVSKWIIGYGICPLIGGAVIWWKQGKYLTEEQPLAFLLFGPLTPLIALLPKSFFTNREEQGK